MKARSAAPEDVLSVWFLWATHVHEDLRHLKPRLGFPPPDEVTSWPAVRMLSERKRRPRVKLKPAETALLIDVGDWIIEQASIETENAAQTMILLQAASIFAHAFAGQQCTQTEEIYNHLADVWGVMPPPVNELPKTYGRPWNAIDRDRVMAVCSKLLRDEDLVPSWFIQGKPIPAHELREQLANEAEQTPEPKSVSPKVADLFEDIVDDDD